MDNISANITEIPEDISANINEIPENISANISEPTVQLGIATYEMDFSVDSSNDVWAFYSKHFGSITKVELTNIDSYTIDGVAESLPFAITLNTTYLIEITKTNPSLAATIKFTVIPSAYDELQNVVDFNIGDGRWTYLLGDDTDVATNRTLLKYDNDLFTIGNYAGAGVFIVNPLLATLTLPLLPSNTYWRQKIYLTTDKIILVAGSIDSGNDNNYFSLVDTTTNQITDLDGNIDQYTILSCSNRLFNTVPQQIFYDYVNKYLYVKNDSIGDFGFYRLNLNDNSYTALDDNLLQTSTNADLRFKKTLFNPYKECFYVNQNEVYPEDEENGITFNDGVLSIRKVIFNRINGKYYTGKYKAFFFLNEYNEKSKVLNIYNASGTVEAQSADAHTIDHDNNVILSFVYNRSRYSIYRVDDLNNKSYIFEGIYSVNYAFDSQFCKNNLHIVLSSTLNRIYLIDASDPTGTPSPDFGYLDLPVNCWSLCSNRIL